MSQFPLLRLRRLRETLASRALWQENHLTVHDLIAPIFVVPGKQVKTAIATLPGQFHFSVDESVREAKALQALGVPAVILFGIPTYKDTEGSSSWQDDNVVQEATRAIKAACPDLIVMADLCFCEYTDHGHCGVPCGENIDNDATLKNTALQTVSLAKAGVDIIAPSGMMDGVVSTIRSTLDEHGYSQTAIMAYSAKYASSFYGPFREAVLSTPSFGDRRSYQMNPANRREAMREIALDIEEGADMVMVKPALAFLDIVYEAKQSFDCPMVAYNVSGEYSMIKSAAAQGLIDGETMMMESLLSMKRAGADAIITYFAREAAELLK